MSKKCELTGKAPLKGHKVSHSNNKVKRKFFPNLKNVTFKKDSRKDPDPIIVQRDPIMETIPLIYKGDNNNAFDCLKQLLNYIYLC